MYLQGDLYICCSIPHALCSAPSAPYRMPCALPICPFCPPQHCTRLTFLTIGNNNHIHEDGARAIAERCTGLTALSIGNKNGIGEGGARMIARNCPSLTSLRFGSNNNIGYGTEAQGRTG